MCIPQVRNRVFIERDMAQAEILHHRYQIMMVPWCRSATWQKVAVLGNINNLLTSRYSLSHNYCMYVDDYTWRNLGGELWLDQAKLPQ